MTTSASPSAPPPDLAAGLSSPEASRLLREHGPNRLAEAQRRSSLAILADQFRNFLIIVLLVAAAVAAAVGDLKDTGVIGVVLVLNAVLGFVQEQRAEESLAALKSMLVATATVRRDGEIMTVPAEEIVPGDVVLVDAGDRVPADGRVLVAHAFEVDESTLTGESTPVAKEPGGPTAEGALADRTGAVFMNTTVTRGRAEVEVTATGMDTEIGSVAGMLQSTITSKTPLQRQLDVLGKRLALVALVAVVAFLVLELLRGGDWSDTLLAAVALAVAAIPEGLPAVVTVTLAVGTYQLARRGAIVKRLPSVETLGATSVICSDKTGTLTVNQMTARVLVAGGRRYEVSGEGYSGEGTVSPPFDEDALVAVRTGVLCNNSAIRGGELVGDPTEGALLPLAVKAGLDVDGLRSSWQRGAELPFESRVKAMATFDRPPDGRPVVAHVKGAFEVLVERSHLDEGELEAFRAAVHALASEGLRVLALARRPVDVEVTADTPFDVLRGEMHDLELVAVVGLGDPPRPEAREAIDECRSAGVEVKMITGDHADTARAIAQQLGIDGDVLTGTELSQLDDTELDDRIDGIGVVARVSPDHKVRIVRALQARGHVVAMTGDGVNDAPALKAADIGVAMGVTGTEVSKEAAAMVLTDDNFATIVGAVRQGRTIYSNIVAFVRFQLATNIGAIITLLSAPLLGLPVPFTAVQLLWVNIIMDGPPAMALGIDPPRADVMEHPPRDPHEGILTARRLGTLVATGAVMAIGTLSVLGAVRAATGTPDGEAEALTMAFTTFVLFQLFNALNARTEVASVFGRSTFTNPRLWAALATVALLQLAAVHVPVVQNLFETSSLSWGEWLLCSAVASSILWVEEVRKLVVRRRARR